jgi:hypothetical protein
VENDRGAVQKAIGEMVVRQWNECSGRWDV